MSLQEGEDEQQHKGEAACGGSHRDGSRSAPSKSVTGGGGQTRQHVDSLALRGKRVARALTYADVSCEILSKMGETAVARNPVLEEIYGPAGYRERSGDYYGGGSCSVRNGGGKKGGYAKTVSQGLVGVKSSGETPIYASKAAEVALDTNSSSNNRGSNSRFCERASNQIISGIGPPELGLNPMGVTSLSHMKEGTWHRLNVDMDKGSTKVQQIANTANPQVSVAASNTEAYDPDLPFVFRAGTSSARKIRKSKKEARGPDQGLMDLLCHESMFKVGSKRATGHHVINNSSQRSIVERIKEAVMEDVLGDFIPLNTGDGLITVNAYYNRNDI
ncbi:hypothetical protein COLO4_29409 [Corchorus olitorius]|uniref:Uncharacterized protein n=1 Tax=Corchorus olitorius TaxID=93759 RepID=A0A1R3HES8_9ROSI|nr:hypothetical protein COLO4_29409 [Corchorus olitorius]